MTERTLSLAVNGREHQLKGRLVLFEAPGMDPGPGPWGGNGAGSAAIVGLGYVGLPTVAALHGRCGRIIGVDANPERLREIEAGEADLSGPDRARLDAALGDESLDLTCDPAAVAKADAVAERARDVLAADGRTFAGAKVIVVGVSYKAGVQDLRESSALPLIARLLGEGADVGYHDPLIPRIRLPGGIQMQSQDAPAGSRWDLAVVHTLHPRVDYSWVRDCQRVLDATYQFGGAPHRVVI